MTTRYGLGPYAAAFAPQAAESPFLQAYDWEIDKPSLQPTRSWTRGDFLRAACVAATLLQERLPDGARQAHAFTANQDLDLLWRLGARLAGTTPVTLNWQADDLPTMRDKLQRADCRLLLLGNGFNPQWAQELAAQTDCPLLAADSVLHTLPSAESQLGIWEPSPEGDQMIVFTSGTTGQPKGVRLSARAYAANAATFQDFLQVQQDSLSLIVVNPLHHTNATAMSDWALRRPGTQLHLLSRYATSFWPLLMRIAAGESGRTVVNLVARHFDFWHELQQRGEFKTEPWFGNDSLRHQLLANLDLLLGSAPVGPATVKRVIAFSGRPPLVRFGSTECCLQVLGTPRAVPQPLAAFQAGWEHPEVGYYIGKPHPPWTQVRLVRAIDPAAPGYLEDCLQGQLGYFICRGQNLMSGYCGQPNAQLFADGWYLGLRDMGFWLPDPQDGQPRFYWSTRDSALLIRGGANYAYEQIAEALAKLLIEQAGWSATGFQLAVIAQRKASEHEDSCCVLIENPQGTRDSDNDLQAAESLKSWLREKAPKWARPDQLKFGQIPRNFKGAIRQDALKAMF